MPTEAAVRTVMPPLCITGDGLRGSHSDLTDAARPCIIPTPAFFEEVA